MKIILRNRLWVAVALVALGGCTAEPEPTPPQPTPSPSPSPTCSAATPVCDPGCGVGATCTFASGACACVPVVPTCSAATPVCDAACGAGQTCTFAGGACACTDDTPTCNAAAPVCVGGCAADQLCGTDCTCQARPTCQPDAPVCPGAGPNSGCAAGQVCNASCACEAEPPPPPGPILPRASRSTAVDITRDDGIVAMVNTDDGSVSFFNVTFGQETRIARTPTSRTLPASEPQAVVIHPDGARAFVANRASGTVSRIVSISSAQAALDAEVEVGGEPMGLALTPSGAKLWVTDWVSGRVSVIDTTTMQVERRIDVGGNPFAIAITNDLDTDDADEQALITQFYARPRAAAAVKEGTDDGKEGVVQVIGVGASRVEAEIVLAPIGACFSAPVGTPPVDVTSGCFPNQLYGISLHRAFGKTRAYVVSVGASPAGPVNFNHNVQAVISVIDVETRAEEPTRTQNLNKLIREQQNDTDGDDNVGRRFLNTPVGIDFVNRDDVIIGYVASAASNVVLRVLWDEAGAVTVGAPQSFNIGVGQNPQGIVTKVGSARAGAFVSNLISRDLSVVSFTDQRQLKVVPSTDVPTDATTDAFKVWRGKFFFNTSTGIWSREGWGSCQGCHPFGLTDNVTWKFPAGPRQTIALDGQFASNDPRDMRALNWTAIFDETADFENNVRDVSGGRGTLQNGMGPLVSPMGPTFSAILAEDGVTRENHQALNGSLVFVARNNQLCTNANTCPDWDLVDRYIQTIRSSRGKANERAQVTRGREVFEEAGCNKCHAGPKWTVSRTFYTPERFAGMLPTRAFDANRAFTTMMNPATLRGLPMNVVRDTTLVAGDDSMGGMPALKRQACNVRDVGTFGLADAAVETRVNGSPAQGRSGFNPPSLLSLATGAPYYHNGAATTLADALGPRFTTHLTAGAPNPPTQGDVTALIAFLETIDESTTPFDVVANTTLCPVPFAP